MSKIFLPNFLALSEIEESLLASRLEAVRSVIAHAGEKGRSLEAEVMSLLRAFLPAEYGLSTGFVVYHSDAGPQLSTQMDVIIYDSIRSGPIARLSTCDVLPLEAVYGYVEIKATLQSTSDAAKSEGFPANSIEKCIETNRDLRMMTQRRFWKPSGPTSAALITANWISLRSYVFAFSADGTIANDPEAFAQRLSDYSSRVGHPAHFHGVLVAGTGYYSTVPINDTQATADAHHVRYTVSNPLAAFKWSLLHDLARFPRFEKDCTPALDQYTQYTTEPTWSQCAPRPQS